MGQSIHSCTDNLKKETIIFIRKMATLFLFLMMAATSFGHIGGDSWDYWNYHEPIDRVCKLPLTVAGASGTYGNRVREYGPQQALTKVSRVSTGYWHSNGEKHPWISFKLPKWSQDIHSVLVEDRRDCCIDRFQDVTVSIGYGSNNPNIHTRMARTSCGTQSYKGNGKTSYKFDCPEGTHGRYVFIQKGDTSETPLFLHINHVEVNGQCLEA